MIKRPTYRNAILYEPNFIGPLKTKHVLPAVISVLLSVLANAITLSVEGVSLETRIVLTILLCLGVSALMLYRPYKMSLVQYLIYKCVAQQSVYKRTSNAGLDSIQYPLRHRKAETKRFSDKKAYR